MLSPITSGDSSTLKVKRSVFIYYTRHLMSVKYTKVITIHTSILYKVLSICTSILYKVAKVCYTDLIQLCQNRVGEILIFRKVKLDTKVLCTERKR